jgi:NADPH:quinone reductase-like Zn-dependent oxidoreductase
MEYMKSLGADHVIGYAAEDFTKNRQVCDVIFDTVGKTSIARPSRSLKKDGWYLLSTFSLTMLIQLVRRKWTSSQHFGFGILAEESEDLVFLKELIETGVIRPVIDRIFPMEQVIDAHRYLESG